MTVDARSFASACAHGRPQHQQWTPWTYLLDFEALDDHNVGQGRQSCKLAECQNHHLSIQPCHSARGDLFKKFRLTQWHAHGAEGMSLKLSR